MKISKKQAYVLFLLISIVAFSRWLLITGFEQFGGSGDFVATRPTVENLVEHFYVYYDLHGGGQFRPFSSSSIVPLEIIIALFEGLGFSSYHSVLFYIVLAHFFCAVFMFELLLYLRSKYFNQRSIKSMGGEYILPMIFASLYSFAPFFGQFYLPGHFDVLLSGLMFPAVLLFLDKFMSGESINWKYLLILFLLLFFTSAGLGNLAYFLVYIIVFTLYGLALFATKPDKWRQILAKLSIFVITYILASFWWFLGTLYYFGSSFVRQLSYSSDNIGSALSIAVSKSQIHSVLFGLANVDIKGLWYAIYVAVFLLLLLPALAFITKYPKKNSLFIVFILVSVFLVAGTNPPFGEVFDYLYRKVPGFEIFRRPSSKIYWLYLFSFACISYLGFEYYLKVLRIKEWVGQVVAALILAVFVLLFAHEVHIVPFNIPQYFFDAEAYLREDQAHRLLLLPHLEGAPPFYGEDMSFVGGQNIETGVLKIPSLSFDVENSFSLNPQLDAHMKSLYQNLSAQASICEDLQQLGISHALLRKNIVNKDIEDPIHTVEQNLDASQEFASKNVFGNLVVYSVSPECEGKIVGSETPDSHVAYERLNPALYRVVAEFPEDAERKEIHLLNNYDPGFALFSAQTRKLILPTQYLEYANMYDLGDSQGSGVYYLVFVWQYIFYASVVVTLGGFCTYAFLYLRQRQHA